jgi:hypothetical protein
MGRRHSRLNGTRQRLLGIATELAETPRISPPPLQFVVYSSSLSSGQPITAGMSVIVKSVGSGCRAAD